MTANFVADTSGFSSKINDLIQQLKTLNQDFEQNSHLLTFPIKCDKMSKGVIVMIRAAICDDEAYVLSHLCKRISEEFRNRNAECSLDKFMFGNKFLEAHREQPYDVIFLDIDMPQTGGFEVAEQVNTLNPNGDTLIVFVTSHDELVYSSFKFRPFRFIRKAYLDQELPEIIAAVISEIAKRTAERKFTLRAKTGDVVIDLRDLQYIEIYGHRLLVHVKSGEPLECYGSLSDLEKELLRYDFVRTHKSFLVNCACIYSIEKNRVILDDKTEIPLSRYKSETVRNKFVKLLQGTL